MEHRVVAGVQVHDVRVHHADEWPDHGAGSEADPLVLLRRLANHRARIDGVAPPGDGLHLEDGKRRRLGVVAVVVAEGALQPALARGDGSLEDEFGVGRHRQVEALGAHQLGGASAEEPRQPEFVEILRQRQDGGEHGERIAAEDHGRVEGAAQALRLVVVAPPALHALPVHAGRGGVEHLEAVEAEVADAGRRMVGQRGPEGDEGPGVARPAPEIGEAVEARRLHHLLHRGPPDHPRPEEAGAQQRAAELPELPEGGRVEPLEGLDQLAADRLGRPAQGQLHATIGAVEVHD